MISHPAFDPAFDPVSVALIVDNELHAVEKKNVEKEAIPATERPNQRERQTFQVAFDAVQAVQAVQVLVDHEQHFQVIQAVQVLLDREQPFQITSANQNDIPFVKYSLVKCSLVKIESINGI